MILKQHQNEVNEIRAERLAHTTNPFALVAQQQPIYHPQIYPNHYTQNSSTKSQQDAIRNRGKAFVNSPLPTYDQEPEMVTEDDVLSKEKEIDKLMALISLSFKKIYKPTNNNLRTSSNTSRANQDNSPRINKGTGYDNQRTVNVVGAWENVADWRDDTIDELDYQKLEAHYIYMEKVQEVTPDDAENSRPNFDTEPLQKDDDDDLGRERDLKAHLQDKGIAISELKKLIENMKGKLVETMVEKPSVIRQPNAFKSQRQPVLGKPTTFLDSLAKTDCSKSKSVTTNNVSNDFSKSVTAQILPQNVKSILNNINVIAPGMYKVHTKPNQTRTLQLPQDIRKTNKRVSFSTEVIPITSVSRPQIRSNRLEDTVMHNNNEGKKQQVEDHHRNFKFSNNKTFVAACNDSLNDKTLNVNFVYVTCGKCVLNDNHDMSVFHYINGMNYRTKMTMAVPISTREPKRTLLEIILFIIDSRHSKHMTGNLKLLRLNHNLFSVGQFCDADLEVSFRKSTCYICDLKGNDLLTGSCGTDLYSITLQETSTPNNICLMAKAKSSQA
uniref:Integrase, catalytic region, zinc finger, CCHC-type, peptidase aspartic, catalytic n=1 Tax=Tanacetum cinerariifolium TaxID=118510 RepID=A0A699I8W4_TANCI|nr:integrase, catalytic region, zinc finger, CCHC-type, peptidase aspartic, catalytic [Tanacetum cinerariifolium]